MIKVLSRLVLLLSLFVTADVAAQAYYGLFASPARDESILEMKQRGGENVISWKCYGCSTTDSINLKRGEFSLRPSDQHNPEYAEYTEKVSVPIKSPYKVLPSHNGVVTYKELGFSSQSMRDSVIISLTFKKSGFPDTLYVGMSAPDRSIKLPKPRVICKEVNPMYFCQGQNLHFEAELPKGLTEGRVAYDWFLDGEPMTGRNDRWFETYSRTMWNEGIHTVSCQMQRIENGKRVGKASERTDYIITQNPANECRSKIEAYPYWGADCAVDGEPTEDLKYNPMCEWGSFSIQPVEKYAHYYMVVIGRTVKHKTVTNDTEMPYFRIVEENEMEKDYQFFDVPMNVKIEAQEPFNTQTIYFRFIGDTVNYSTIPYIHPKVDISPKDIAICENSFDESFQGLSAEATEFTTNTVRWMWYYCETSDGKYERLDVPTFGKLWPSRAGFYKVIATDGVYVAESEPVEVKSLDNGCEPVKIMYEGMDEGVDPSVCKGGTVELKASLIGDEYEYQWAVGPANATLENQLQKIAGATGSVFNAPVSKQDEFYYLIITRNKSAVVISKGVQVRTLSFINGDETVRLQVVPGLVCEGSKVYLKATTTHTSSSGTNEMYDYTFYRKGVYDYNFVKIGKDIGSGSIGRSMDFVQSSGQYRVVLRGCNKVIEFKELVAVTVRNDEKCSLGDLYVKESGHDKENDGRSWDNAFATIDRAISKAFDMRESEKYKDVQINIHVADGTYYPPKEGYDFPSNTTVYGGYDISPVDGTVSGTYRSPRSPANMEGNITMFKSESPDGYIVNLKDRENVRLCGISFYGSSLSAESSLNGRGLRIDGSDVAVDSCVFSGFFFSNGTGNDTKLNTAIYIDKSTNEKTSHLRIDHTTMHTIKGGDMGACISISDSAVVEIFNSTFSNNSTGYFGGVVLMTLQSSPIINIYNTTFYDNTITSGVGYWGRALLRSLGGNPEINIYSSTICGRMYKEYGTLKIYNSLVECVGRTDVYEHNYPVKPNFKENLKDEQENYTRAFMANFKGSLSSKLTSRGGLTQVLVPSNKLEVVGRAGVPHPMTPKDQRGIQRSPISSTYGACDADYSLVINVTDKGCPDNKNTVASMNSIIAGIENPKYQWVNNYTDLNGQTGPELKNTGIGTYWLEAEGSDLQGNIVKATSNEIRISDICEEPGIYYVKTKDKGGDDTYNGATWDQAFESIDKAIETASVYKKNAGSNKPVTIHVASGDYNLKSDEGLAIGSMSGITIIGGYSASPSKGAKRNYKRSPEDRGFDTRINTHSKNGKVMNLTSQNSKVRFATIHFVGTDNRTVPVFSMSGGELTIDSCQINGFVSEVDAPVFSVVKTSTLKINSCYIFSNQAANGAVLSVGERGNKSSINLMNSTLEDNVSVTNGGAVFYAAGSSPTVFMTNNTILNSVCRNPKLSATCNFRIPSGGTQLVIAHCTMNGPMFFESGKVSLFNSIIEAEGRVDNKEGVVCISKVEIKSVSDRVTSDDCNAFKALFETKKLGRSNTPYLPLIAPLDKVLALDKDYEHLVSTDQRGEKRGEKVTPGAIEQDPVTTEGQQ